MDRATLAIVVCGLRFRYRQPRKEIKRRRLACHLAISACDQPGVTPWATKVSIAADLIRRMSEGPQEIAA
jgi:hypothetical protein